MDVDPILKNIKVDKNNINLTGFTPITTIPSKKKDSSEEQVYSVYWGSDDNEQKTLSDAQLMELDNISLLDLLSSEGFVVRQASGYRPNALTAQGRPSYHSMGDANNPGAIDIVPLAGTYDEFEQRIYSNPRVLAWLDRKGWGTLREDKVVNGQRGFLRVDGTFANTNATGNHFHFGPDKRALEWKEYNRN